jgi:hypothetical protein
MATEKRIGGKRASLEEIRNSLKTQTLNSVREILSDARIEAALQAAEYEYRQRLVPPQATIFHMIAAAIWPEDSFEASWQILWDTMASRIPGAAGQSPGSGSMAKARKRLPLAVWEKLFASVSDWGQQMAKRGKNWRGHRLVLVDTTTVSMPDEPALFQEFGGGRSHGKKYKYPLARLVGLSLADSMFAIGYRLGRYNDGEWSLARPLLSHLKPGDLLIGDRQYAAAHYYAEHRARGIHFLTRAHQCLRVDRLKRVKVHNEDDFIAEVPINPMKRREDPSLPETVRVRFFRAKVMIRGKRETIWMATSLLDAARYPAADVAVLYARRWRIETWFRQLKVDLGADVLRSKTPKGIRKEVAARMLALNAIRLLILQAAEAHGMDPMRVSFVGAMRAILSFAPAMAISPVWQLPAIHAAMLTEIASHCVPERPGRNEPRAIRRERVHYPTLKTTRAEWRLTHAS